jgi:hypothetical protein
MWQVQIGIILLAFHANKYILLEKQVSDYWSGRKLIELNYHALLNSVYFRQSWTKPLKPFQPILQSYWTLTKQTLSPPPPQFNVVNNAETTFGNIPWHKINIELGERGLKKGNMIQHGVYHKNTMRIFYRGKIVSTSYVQDCTLC